MKGFIICIHMQMDKIALFRKKLLNNQRIEECALRFGITGDETRLKICYLLCHQPEITVTEISRILGSPISTVSHSLKRLKEIDIVANRRQVKNIIYYLKKNSFTSMLKTELIP